MAHPAPSLKKNPLNKRPLRPKRSDKARAQRRIILPRSPGESHQLSKISERSHDMEKNTELEASGSSDAGAPLILQADSQQEHASSLPTNEFSKKIEGPTSLGESQPHVAEQEAKPSKELTVYLAPNNLEPQVLPNGSSALKVVAPSRPQDSRQV